MLVNTEKSSGKGKTMVELCSTLMFAIACRNRSWIADEFSARMSEASFSALDELISPSAAVTWIGQTVIMDMLNISLIAGVRTPKGWVGLGGRGERRERSEREKEREQYVAVEGRE